MRHAVPARIVIVGASLAGLRAAQALRTGGFEGEVVLIGAETHRPYSRPPLSKELLAGEHDADACGLEPSTIDVTWRLGEQAVELDATARTVQLASGAVANYDRLIIATGCRARAWAGPGADLDGLFTLRNLEDALALRRALKRAAKVVVVGAGFVGCEVAATARRLGAEVTLIEQAPFPLAPFGERFGQRVLRLHEERGVDVRVGVGVRGFSGAERLEAVELDDGSRVPADAAVVALGAVTNTDWLATAGLPTAKGGILCAPTLTVVGAEDILCAGGVTCWPHPLASGEAVRIEHWTNASEQGRRAGKNALLAIDRREPFESVPFVWSDQYEVKLQSAGFPALADTMEIVEEDGDSCVAVGTRGELVVAAIAWNSPRRLMAYRKALAQLTTRGKLIADLAPSLST